MKKLFLILAFGLIIFLPLHFINAQEDTSASALNDDLGDMEDAFTADDFTDESEAESSTDNTQNNESTSDNETENNANQELEQDGLAKSTEESSGSETTSSDSSGDSTPTDDTKTLTENSGSQTAASKLEGTGSENTSTGQQTDISSNKKSQQERVRGQILLKVEDHGKAYYVNPKDDSLNFLGRPDDAFTIMRDQGIGITNANLDKIPIGGVDLLAGKDTDGDGLPDDFENAIESYIDKKDTDGDGFDDKTEVTYGFSPVRPMGNLVIDENFVNTNKGKIFLQVQNHGEAWYVNPTDGKRYFLGRPTDAYNVMWNLGLGISNTGFDWLQ